MGLINYKDIDFNKSIDKENKVINFNGLEIQIVQYLSTNDKYDLVMGTLQKSLMQNNIFNPFKIDMYFDLHVVYMYTNILFSIDDRADEIAIYDTLKKSGLIDRVKAEIDEVELNQLKGYIYQLAELISKDKNTFGSIVNNLIEQLPQFAEKIQTVASKIDPEMIQKLMNSVQQQVKDNE